MFIHLPGTSKERAFEIGSEISAAVSSHLPSPMKLNFEKVLWNCARMAREFSRSLLLFRFIFHVFLKQKNAMLDLLSSRLSRRSPNLTQKVGDMSLSMFEQNEVTMLVQALKLCVAMAVLLWQKCWKRRCGSCFSPKTSLLLRNTRHARFSD